MSKKGKKKKRSSENPTTESGTPSTTATTTTPTPTTTMPASNESYASTTNVNPQPNITTPTNLPPPYTPPPKAAFDSSQTSQKTPKLQKSVLLEKDKGIAAFKKNDLISALTAFSKAIVSTQIDHPLLPSLYTQRALCYLRLGNHGAAVEDATHALKLNPKYVKAYVCRGVGYFRLKYVCDTSISSWSRTIVSDRSFCSSFNTQMMTTLLHPSYSKATLDFKKRLPQQRRLHSKARRIS